MQAVSVKEIVDITGGKLICGNTNTEIRDFSLDSRTLQPGAVFIAIKGNNFDGHQFIKEVINKGVIGIIVKSEFELPDNLPRIVIKVEDTIKAIGDIARIYRNRFKGPVIAVTGTVGKTTAKEFIATVLEEKFHVHKTKGTLNNHIGVPTTLWGLESEHGVSVIELGMSGTGEIKYLADIAQPDVGVITNIGPAHLLQLGSVENIIAAKAELLTSMRGNGLVVLNRDNEYFTQLRDKTRCRFVTVGKHLESDFQTIDLAVDKESLIVFKILVKPFSDILEVKLPVIGLHNIYPALVSVAIGYGLGLKPEEIINGLAKIELPKMRLELKEIAGIKIIDDCYNANPISMASALETLSMWRDAGKKILVCSDMLELGQDACIYHKELGKQVVKSKIDRLITIGELSELVSGTAVECGMASDYVRHCKNNIEAVEVLGKWLEPGDVILVKGSRARRMEEIVKWIEEYYSTLERLIV